MDGWSLAIEEAAWLCVLEAPATKADYDLLFTSGGDGVSFTCRNFALDYRPNRIPAALRQAHKRISQMARVHIGNGEWLSEDGEKVPPTVEAILDIVGDEPTEITDDLINRIIPTFELPNSTALPVGNDTEIVNWLHQQKGKQVFVWLIA